MVDVAQRLHSAFMPKITRDRLLERIRQLRGVAVGLSSAEGTGSEAYLKWKGDVTSLLANVYGDEDRRTKAFSTIGFTPNVISVNGTRDSRWPDAFDRGVKRSCAFLDSLAEEVEEFYDDQPNAATPDSDATAKPNPNAQNKVFVVHGRNSLLAKGMFGFLRAISLQPMEWAHAVALSGRPMPYVGEVLHAAFSNAAAVVVLMTPDDVCKLRDECARANDPPHETQFMGQARPNVLFEAGMAMGYAPDRTIIVEVGELRTFSDVAGLHVIRMDGTSQRRQELAHRLQACGCNVDLSGTDWHTAGDLRSELATAPQPGSRPKTGDVAATNK